MKSESGWNGKKKWVKTKSTSRWNLQVGEEEKISGWKRNLQVGEICKWVKSASGWKKKWVKTTHLKKEVGENVKFHQLSTKMKQIHPHFRNVNKFTHYSSRHTHLRGCFGWWCGGGHQWFFSRIHFEWEMKKHQTSQSFAICTCMWKYIEKANV